MTQREQARTWIVEHRDRLARDARRMTPRATVRCPEGCALFRVYDFPRLGRVIVKAPMTRGREHAQHEALDTAETAVIAAPVEVLIAAAGEQYVSGLLACEHVEASVSPDHLRWLAQRTGRHAIDLSHNGIDWRQAPGLSGGEVTVTSEAIAPPPPD